MAERAIAHVTQNYSRERMTTDTLAIYDELLTDPAPQAAQSRGMTVAPDDLTRWALAIQCRPPREMT